MYQVVPIFCNLQLFVIPNFLIENSGDQTQNGSGLGGGDVNRKPGKEMHPENQETWIRNRDQTKKRWIGNRDEHRKPENLDEEPRSNKKHGLGTESKNLKIGIGNKDITKKQDWEQKTKDWKQGPLLSLNHYACECQKVFLIWICIVWKTKNIICTWSTRSGQLTILPQPPKMALILSISLILAFHMESHKPII